MLSVISTPNHTGVKISGDYFDLEELNQSIYKIIGDEGKYFGFEGGRKRILSVAYRIRQAAQGDQNIEFVFNALHEQIKKKHGFIAPNKNIYYSTEILWPEILFTAFALKNFVQFYSKETASSRWDLHFHTVMKFQSLILDCLRGHTSEEAFNIIQQAFDTTASTEDYAIQYIDLLNVRYIGLTAAQRLESLPAISLKIFRQDQDYINLRNQILQAASSSKKAIHDVPLSIRYPEEIEW